MARSANPPRSDADRSLSAPFATQRALARMHPHLAPLQAGTNGWVLDLAAASGWFELAPTRGFAGYGLSRALRMLLDVLSGLAALHDTQTESGSSFVHGELVPALLRVDLRGAARLMPLAARHWQSGELPLPTESLGHLAPERLLGDAIDIRADVFSAGVLLWEALAGRRLFEHETVEGIITRLMGDKVQVPELPPELAWALPLKAVALRALAVDPERRFSNCVELARTIETVAHDRVATHAEVAAFFKAPILPPPQPFQEEFRLSPHKSSLSALVSVTTAPSASERVESDRESESKPSRAPRAIWTALAFLSLPVAFAVGVLTRHDRARVSESATASPVAPTVTATALVPGVALAPAPSASATGAAPLLEEAHPTVGHGVHTSTRAAPAKRDGKGRAPPKAAKPAAVSRPVSGDREAEQYGI